MQAYTLVEHACVHTSVVAALFMHVGIHNFVLCAQGVHYPRALETRNSDMPSAILFRSHREML